MSNHKPDFSTVIKTSIKHPKNICPSSKRNTNQDRVTFQPNISKIQFLSSIINCCYLSSTTDSKLNSNSIFKSIDMVGQFVNILFFQMQKFHVDFSL